MRGTVEIFFVMPTSLRQNFVAPGIPYRKSLKYLFTDRRVPPQNRSRYDNPVFNSVAANVGRWSY